MQNTKMNLPQAIAIQKSALKQIIGGGSIKGNKNIPAIVEGDDSIKHLG